MIRIINANVIEGLRSLPEKSVHCVVTSPPYWGLRDYGVDDQIGLESTPEEYVEKLVTVFREVRRVLRDDGTLWLNLGDCYTSGNRKTRDIDKEYPARGMSFRPQTPFNLKQKDLIGLPWRVAFALQADGWYLRSDIIWAKPNPMPESVTDRPTKSHEYVFLLTKNPKYFYDANAIREPAIRAGEVVLNKNGKNNQMGRYGRTRTGFLKDGGVVVSDYRNRRDVWEIATQPFPDAHFATFPEALVEPCIKAGTSERGCCSECGAPWSRVIEKAKVETNYDKPRKRATAPGAEVSKTSCIVTGDWHITTTKGWRPTCTCNAETVPCVVLDPFGGSGTVAKVARDLNRNAILIEINPAYVEIARNRLRANEQLFENVRIECESEG